MTDPTKAVCSTCGREGRVFVKHTVKIASRYVQWLECGPCMKAADERLVAAIREADRVGVS